MHGIAGARFFYDKVTRRSAIACHGNHQGCATASFTVSMGERVRMGRGSAPFEGVELWKRNGGKSPGKSERHGTWPIYVLPDGSPWLCIPRIRSRFTSVDISCVFVICRKATSSCLNLRGTIQRSMGIDGCRLAIES